MRALVASLGSETRGLTRDSFALALANAITAMGVMVQIALITHYLGLKEYGIFATIVAFVAVVDRFFDVQVADATIAHAAGSMRDNPRAAAGIGQLGYLIDCVAGIVGFGVVALLAPIVAGRLTDVGDSLPFVLYAVTLLISTVDATSLAFLRLLGRFRLILGYVAVREVLRLVFVGIAIFVFGSLIAVILALVVLDCAAALLAAGMMMVTFFRTTGVRMTDRSLFPASKERRSMLTMVFHTNLIAYVKLLVSQGPTLVLGFLAGPTQVGLFKLGTAYPNGVGRIFDSVWWAVTPRLAKLWNSDKRHAIWRLIREGTCLAFAVTTAVGALVILLREPLLRLLGGEAATAAGTVLILAMVSRIVNGTFFWNSALLYGAKRAATASKMYLLGFLLFAPALVLFTQEWGADGAAGAILLWSAVTNVGLTVAAWRVLRQGTDVAPSPAALTFTAPLVEDGD